MNLKVDELNPVADERYSIAGFREPGRSASRGVIDLGSGPRVEVDRKDPPVIKMEIDVALADLGIIDDQIGTLGAAD